MRFIVLAVMVLALLASLWDRSVAHKDRENFEGNRKPSVLADDVHEALLDLVEGKAQPPVKERTRAMRAAAVRYWRAGGKISVKADHGDKALYYEGRRLLKSSEVNKVVVEEFERTKGSGAGKLACSLRDNFLGVSRAKIQTILNTDKSHYRRNAKFLNKAKLKPIRARDVHVRHQIDMMDMSKIGYCTGTF